jgi:hypothetical protein
MQLHAALALLVAALGTSTATATPNPKQLVWRFDGQNDFEWQGMTISSAGDADGDGVADVIIGLHTVKSGLPGNHVSARVYSGKTGILLLTINATISQVAESFNTVAGLGDLTGDGKSEIAVGTPGANVVRIFNANGALLGTLSGPAGPGVPEFGASLAAAGDTNGDGKDDIIVGAPGTGAAYVYSGNVAAGFPLLATLAAGSHNRFGASVGRAGDVNGNGTSEVLVGGPLFTTQQPLKANAGAVYVFDVGNPTDPVFTVYGSAPHDLLGIDVDGGRDLNGDGIPDFMASAVGTDYPAPKGQGYVRTYSGANAAPLKTFMPDVPQTGDLFGFSAKLGNPCSSGNATLIVGAPVWRNAADEMTGRVIAFSATTGAQITEIPGEELLDGMGRSVDGFVDLNGDGKAEFLVGAHGTTVPPVNTGGSAFAYSCTNIPRPDISAVPSPAHFGDVPVGEGKSMVVEIQNQGDASLQLSSLALVGGSSPAFSVAGPALPLSIPPGESEPVTVEFNPGMALTHAGVLRAQSNDPDNPAYDIVLTGTGLKRDIEVTPASVAFGKVDQGDTVWKTVKVTNVGNQPLTVNSIALASNQSGDFGLSSVPALPQTLLQYQELNFLLTFKPSAQGARTGTIAIGSDDPLDPTIQVPLSGTGVGPNQRPRAVIEMQVPYNAITTGLTIHFHGENSFDPDGSIESYQWNFGDTQGANNANPQHAFPCPTTECRFVVRLTVTDNLGKSDSTSVTVVSSPRDLRSRFYGTIQKGGKEVHDGTIVRAYIAGVLVAESTTQTHLGQSVYAIEIPPDIHKNGMGGENGETVVFKVKSTEPADAACAPATANESGTWYNATDQMLNLTAPQSFCLLAGLDWCAIAKAFGLAVCGPALRHDIYIELQEWPVPPIRDPGPLREIVTAFQLNIYNARTGEQLHRLPATYEIRLRYTDRQLAATGVERESSLGLFYLTGERWLPAGRDALDVANNTLVTSLNHATIFALIGDSRKVDCNDLAIVKASFGKRRDQPGFDQRADVNNDGVIDAKDLAFVSKRLPVGTRCP